MVYVSVSELTGGFTLQNILERWTFMGKMKITEFKAAELNDEDIFCITI